MRTLTVLLLALVLVAGAETVTFQPDAAVGKDTWIYSSEPDTNYGVLPHTYWGHTDDDIVITYIEFTELDESEYQGAAVNNAFLSLYLWSVTGTGDFEVGACEASWNEDTITWNTYVGIVESFSQPFPADGGWITIEVTDYVQNWLDGTWDNYGFCLYNSVSLNVHTTAPTSDYTDDPTLRPKLILDYSGAAIEEATWGEIKASL